MAGLKETGLFGLEEALPSIGWIPQLSSALFDLPQGALSKIMDLERGIYLFEIKEKKNAYLPELAQIKDKVDVAIYFTVGAPESKILSLKESLENLPEVAEVSYISATEALRLFRERHQNDYPTIQALDEIKDNPLGGYLNVKAKEVSQYESIANFMKSDNALVLGSASIVDKVNYH